MVGAMLGRNIWSRLGKQVSGSIAASCTFSSVVLAHLLRTSEDNTLCDAPSPSKPPSPNNESSSSFTKKEEENDYYREYGRFHPQRQIHEPFLPYPAWDYNWDGQQTTFTSPSFIMKPPGDQAFDASKAHGTTRHIILIRHGQYDGSASHDDQQRLTPLGRHQAALTGQRLAVMARGGLQGGLGLSFLNDSNNNKTDDLNFEQPCHIKAIHVSDLTRAKETAEIIASFLPNAVDICTRPDPMLNEALPSP
jgi:hypothetical protein